MLRELKAIFSPLISRPRHDFVPLGRLVSALRARAAQGGPADYRAVLSDLPKLCDRYSHLTPARIRQLIFQQAPDQNQAPVELVANALDATLGEKPIGRFGVGFYQVLSEIENRNENVVVTTFSDEGAFQLSFKNGEYEIRSVEIEPGEEHSGTLVQICKELSEARQAALCSYFKEKMAWYTRAPIYLNRSLLNPLSDLYYAGEAARPQYQTLTPVYIHISSVGYQVRDFGPGMTAEDICTRLLPPRVGRGTRLSSTPEEIEKESGLYFKPARNGNNEGLALIQVNGVTVEKLRLKGLNLPELMIAQLPAATWVPESRNEIALDETVQSALLLLARKIAGYAGEEKFALLNGLAGVVRQLNRRTKQEALVGDLLGEMEKIVSGVLQQEREKNVLLLPSDEIFKHLVVPAGKKIIHLDPALFRFDPAAAGLEAVTSFKSANYQLFAGEFADPEKAPIFVELGRMLVLNRKYYEMHKDQPALLNLLFNFHIGYGKRKKGKGVLPAEGEVRAHYAGDAQEAAKLTVRAARERDRRTLKFLEEIKSLRDAMSKISGIPRIHWLIDELGLRESPSKIKAYADMSADLDDFRRRLDGLIERYEKRARRITVRSKLNKLGISPAVMEELLSKETDLPFLHDQYVYGSILAGGRLFLYASVNKEDVVMDESGKRIAAGFDSLCEMYDIGGRLFILAKKNKKYIVFNEKGERIGGECDSAGIHNIGGKMFLAAKAGEKSYVMNEKGETICRSDGNIIVSHFGEDVYFEVFNDQGMYCLNTKGDEVADWQVAVRISDEKYKKIKKIKNRAIRAAGKIAAIGIENGSIRKEYDLSDRITIIDYIEVRGVKYFRLIKAMREYVVREDGKKIGDAQGYDQVISLYDLDDRLVFKVITDIGQFFVDERGKKYFEVSANDCEVSNYSATDDIFENWLARKRVYVLDEDGENMIGGERGFYKASGVHEKGDKLVAVALRRNRNWVKIEYDLGFDPDASEWPDGITAAARRILSHPFLQETGNHPFYLQFIRNVLTLPVKDEAALELFPFVPGPLFKKLSPGTQIIAGELGRIRWEARPSFFRFLNFLLKIELKEKARNQFITRWMSIFFRQSEKTSRYLDLLSQKYPDGRMGYEYLDPAIPAKQAPATLRPLILYLRGDSRALLKEIKLDKTAPSLWRLGVRIREEFSLADFILARRLQKYPKTITDLNGLRKGLRGVRASMKTAVLDEIRSAVEGMDRSSHVWVRELLQNSRDAIRENGGKRKIFVRSFLREGDWVVRVYDPAGMTIDEVANLLLPLESTKKEGKGEYTGLFGQGFYSLFVDADQVRIFTGAGDGKYYFLALNCVRDGSGRLEDIRVIDIQERIGDFKGTAIERIKRGGDHDLEALSVADAIHQYTGAIAADDAEIFFEGERINEDKMLLASLPVGKMGEFEIYLSPSGRNRVVQDGLFVRDITEQDTALWPEVLKLMLARPGLIISLPKGLPLTRVRNAEARSDRHDDYFARAKAIAAFKAAVCAYLKAGLRVPDLPQDYFYGDGYESRVASWVRQDARSINRGEWMKVDVGKYLGKGQYYFIQLLTLLASPEVDEQTEVRIEGISESVKAGRLPAVTKKLAGEVVVDLREAVIEVEKRKTEKAAAAKITAVEKIEYNENYRYFSAFCAACTDALGVSVRHGLYRKKERRLVEFEGDNIMHWNLTHVEDWIKFIADIRAGKTDQAETADFFYDFLENVAHETSHLGDAGMWTHQAEGIIEESMASRMRAYIERWVRAGFTVEKAIESASKLKLGELRA